MTSTFHIVLAMKPTDGNFAENALKHGVVGLDIDGTRVQGAKGNGVWGTSNETINTDRKFNASPSMADYRSEQHAQGRWPANIILSHSDRCRKIGVKKVKSIGGDISGVSALGQGSGWNKHHNITTPVERHVDVDGMETVEEWECVADCAVKLLGEQSGECKTGDLWRVNSSIGGKGIYQGGQAGERDHKGDSGTASRYFKQIEQLDEREYDEENR